jgi:hypothetical protein
MSVRDTGGSSGANKPGYLARAAFWLVDAHVQGSSCISTIPPADA